MKTIHWFKPLILLILVAYPAMCVVWPMPQMMSTTSTVLTINSKKFTFQSSSKSDILHQAFERYMNISFIPLGKQIQPQLSESFNVTASSGSLTSLKVNVHSSKEELNLDSVENYTLTVTAKGATLDADEVWGALRGRLETFSQLVEPTESGMFQINETKVIDFPRFKHRGMLVDTARHFLDMEVLYEHIDAMAYNKYNVFHWHIVDDESFPYDSKVLPEVTAKGSFNPKTHVYTADDITKIIKYCRYRGLRVIPEFDTPGHTRCWGRSKPNLLTKCYTGFLPNGKTGPINPIFPENYEFMKTLLSEVHKRFTDKYIHLGGDEVLLNCWKSNPDVRNWMVEKGLGNNISLLESYYESRLLGIASNLGYDYIIWQSVVDNNVKVMPSTVVNVYKGGFPAELDRVTKRNFTTILSSCWYLDIYAYGPDWKRYYSCEPFSFNGTQKQYDLIIGGESCIWTEYVDDTNLISRVWPRASGTAERLWSAKNVNSIALATPRIHDFRCKILIRRGIRAEPVTGPGFCEYEFGM
ncbi:uncharacterized protein TRIADDRAFT_30868 [Trichoplax adhaerens]|uniref:Beta-hexosaminidase n=1 Tax=Trichoplax adhaerens TaxID=10228 RepID=B3S8D4_TRIAD|nr:hypothetical protein TRIADDRAFT_30868 [Trichoplax adhaerens]EDV21084.1 hypothetical protein TRIADDRAFT_30868 [Trichoplax adhaerens]|eukprot:XP_002116414.1 hypothetical protein TRIADDRAFT_30868 [Trichoplax adhaerens]